MIERANRNAARPLALTRRAFKYGLLAMTACMAPGAHRRAAHARNGRFAEERARIAPIGLSAFPLEGDAASFTLPDGTHFFETDAAGHHFHMAPRGGKLPEATYRDANSLLFVPKDFQPSERAALVLFLHGNLATLSRDVARRQRVPEQVEKSGNNLLLVAPQFATDALDSSAGNFWTSGFLDRYLEKAARALTVIGAGLSPQPDPRTSRDHRRL